jgi:hypothetical protein
MRPYLGYRKPSDGGFSDAWKKTVIGALLLSDKKTRKARGQSHRIQKIQSVRVWCAVAYRHWVCVAVTTIRIRGGALFAYRLKWSHRYFHWVWCLRGVR